MTHSLTLEQIKDLQQRGYKVTFHVGERKIGNETKRVEYLKVKQIEHK